MGENKWRDEDSWPLERAKPTRYFLHSAARPTAPPATAALSTAPN
jgi:predicted acyl esterase